MPEEQYISSQAKSLEVTRSIVRSPTKLSVAIGGPRFKHMGGYVTRPQNRVERNDRSAAICDRLDRSTQFLATLLTRLDLGQ